MISARLIACAIATTITASIAGQSQQSTNPTAAENKASADKPPVEILSHKIGAEYYSILDRENAMAPPMTAETGDLPRKVNQPSARPGRNKFGDTLGEERMARDRRSSYTRVIDDAQLVQVVVKNTGAKPIKVVEWDFAFLRYENGQYLSHYDVTTKVGIKPGGKKTLKHKLPPGAKRCRVVKVISDENQPKKASALEAVCGRGIHDPSLLTQRRETISIKRIEYADGTVWLKQ
jgi:hypothetical protein